MLRESVVDWFALLGEHLDVLEGATGQRRVDPSTPPAPAPVRFPGIEGGLGEGEQDCLLQIGQVDQSVMTA